MKSVSAFPLMLFVGCVVLPAWAAGGPASQSAASGPAGKAPAASQADRPGWRLVWSDEFDVPGLPDPKKWDYEEGFVRNHESQYYTRARKENCRVEDGTLIIEGRKEPFPNPRGGAAKPAAYTSASIHTKGKASWQYGRLELRAMLPQGRGVWPAFWTLGDAGGSGAAWPGCGEIDIMEFVGKAPDKVHGTLHWDRGGHRQQGGNLAVKQPWADFHVYAVEWSADKIDFYFDEARYLSVPLSAADNGEKNAFRKPHYLKLNLALGGDWGGKIDDSIFPQKFVIDYVRVYEKDAGTASPVPPPSAKGP
jgi:beta-glucanase (GH16 family)